MGSRAWLVSTVAALAGASLLGLACSSTADDESFDADGGVDATTDVGARGDSSTDAGPDATSVPDTGGSTVVGKCSPVQGPACDLVLQDCPVNDAGIAQECLLANGGPPYTTQCFATTASEHLGKGHGCCAGAQDKQCDPGLECIGDPNADCDGGVVTGRCSPHCCGDAIDGGDDYLCGLSDPEGYQGHCDTNLVDSTNTALYMVCSYTRPCEPFGIKPCPGNFTCDFRDTSGSAGCDDIYTIDGGPPPQEGDDCYALNGCADGLACLGNGTPGKCEMMCLAPGSKPPFDAGALDGGPFGGGCSAGKSCLRSISGFPSWIRFCE